MKIIKRLSLFLLTVVSLLGLGISAKALGEENYYVIGDFSDNKLKEEYKMTLNSDGNYEYIFNCKIPHTQFRISNGSDVYKTEGLNKGTSFLLNEAGDYKILFNKEPIFSSSNVEIVKEEALDYYVLGTINNTLSDEYKMNYISYNEYSIDLEIKDYTLIYISDGTNDYKDLNGNDYVIENPGNYNLHFTINDGKHSLKITEIDLNPSFYVLGSFNDYRVDSNSKMSFDGTSYTFRIDTASVESFYITDGENIYKDGRDNYLLEEFKSYLISFNPQTNEVKREEISYYILSIDNDYTENEDYKLEINSDNKDYLEYKYSIRVASTFQFIIGNNDIEYLNNGSSFLIKEGGEYDIYFSPSHKYKNEANVLIKKTKDLEPDYYVLGEFNDHLINIDSLMEKKDNEYIFKVDINKPSSFYITDGENIYRNGKVDYLLDEKNSYLIHFDSVSKKISIETLDYYIMSNDNDYAINDDYRLNLNEDNTMYLEYSFNITVKKAYQFIVGNFYCEYLNNGSSFLIKDEGKYTIYFSPNHSYENGSNVSIRKYKEENNKFYLMGSFNNYEESDDYLLEYNKDNEDYIEYTIELNLAKGSSFYIKGGLNNYYSPKGEEIAVDEEAFYRIYFSTEYDYGNGYHIYYKLVKDEDIKERTLIINNSDELISFIDKANSDSFSTNLTVEIKNDINLNGIEINPIQIFSGVLNGNFHTISNFKLSTKALGNNLAFIRILLEGAEVNNLSLVYDVDIDNSDVGVGGIVGKNQGTIRNSSFSGRLKGVSIVGGIAARNESTGKIINSKSYGDIMGRSFIGGISGINDGLIKESINEAIINNMVYSSNDERRIMNIGGITGFNTNSVISSVNKGKVGLKRLGGFVGGICGNSTGLIKDSYNLGNIYGKKYIGGIAGYYAIMSSNNEDNIYDEIIKEIEDILKKDEEDEFNNSKSKKKTDINASIIYCYNKGLIEGESGVGGITGFSSSEGNKNNKDGYNIKKSYNMGNIKSNSSYAGGIAGEHTKGDISECYNSGIIESVNDYAGGIAGYSNGSIYASFNTGSVKGSSYVGGIGGYINSLNNTYTTAKVYPTDSFVGAIAGDVNEINDNIFNNYYIANGYKAFSNIDYKGKGEEVDRNILASKDILKADLDFKYFMAGDGYESYPILKSFISDNTELKDDFKEDIYYNTSFMCQIIFVDDDGEIASISKVKYGDEFNIEDAPEPLKKEGYHSIWDPSFKGGIITDDVIVQIKYIEIRTSVGSDESNNPEVIIEGSYSPSTSLEVIKTNDNYLANNNLYKHIKTYKLNIVDNDIDINKEKITVNLHLDNNENSIVVMIRDGNPIIIDSEANGSYLRFTLEDSVEFMIVEKEFYNLNNPELIKIISYSSLGVVLGLILVAGGFTIINSKRRKYM